MTGPNTIHRLKREYAGDLDGLLREIARRLHGGPLDKLQPKELNAMLNRAQDVLQNG